MEKSLSKLLTCGHCKNISKMEIIGSIHDNDEYKDPEIGGLVYESGTTYSALRCPACEEINLVRYDWNDMMESEDEIDYEVIFPHISNVPFGLPEKVLKAFHAAEKGKSIDANTYAILLRRLLEIVCIDRNASGKYLSDMLKNLSENGEIPSKLVNVAKGLKELGNIGAHAGSKDLSEREIPILKALSLAILDYVYSAPYLAIIAENQLKKIKRK
jgi:hypothetical protein